MTTCTPCSPNDPLPLYWGRSALTSLTDVQVQALTDTRDQTERFGAFEFPSADQEYLYLALPQSFGQVDTFLFNGLRLSCIETEVDMTIAAVVVPYYVYRSPELTSAEDAVLEIDQ